jgi:hypothetical protein
LVPKQADPDEGIGFCNFGFKIFFLFFIYLFFHFFILTCSYAIQAQHERADNCTLRAENDKIRCENIAIREALRNVICPSCGGPPVTEDSYFDEHKLRVENAQLKEEVTF